MYTPNKSILRKYAEVMVDFALGKGQGIKRGDIVYLEYDSEGLPLALAVYERILEKGGNPIVRSKEELFDRILLESGNEDQLKFVPKKYFKALINTIDHRLYIKATRDPLLLRKVPPKRIMLANEGKKIFKKWFFDKEDKGKLTWSLCLYGTANMAKEAGLTLKSYWEQITKACFLDKENCIKRWKDTFSMIYKIKSKLNKLPVDRFRVISDKTDLYIKWGEKRKWIGGRGANIPSFEIFTAPDWRGTNGNVFFDFPLYRYGNIIKNIYLEFKNGKVVKASADKNEKLLHEMLKQKNADKIGEFSLTDKRLSRIDHFMAETLYDENFGGKYGNCHMALGSSYHDCYSGDKKKMRENNWNKLGFNDSGEHCDIINTLKKEVWAFLKDGSRKLIYKDGQFVI